MMISSRDLATSTVLGVAALLFATSCVSKARYDEATAEVKYYQRLYQDLASFQGELESQNERLSGELGLYENQPIEAAVNEDIDRRMEDLERIAAGIGGSSGDVTVLSVEGGYGLRLADSILFESGSTAIRPEGEKVVLQLAEEIASRPYRRIWVRGHTDADPVKKAETKRRFPHGNLQLSSARAIEVAALLSSKGGLDSKRVVIAGFGPTDPVAPNDSAVSKQRNRRVEIFVIQEDAGEGGK